MRQASQHNRCVQIWLAIEHYYDTATVRGAFECEGDARRFTDGLPHVHIQGIEVHGPGQSPRIVEGWEATARIGVHDPAEHRPPTVTRQVFFPGEAPDWVSRRCEADPPDADGGVLELCYRGSDRGAVFAACRARYDRAVEGLAA